MTTKACSCCSKSFCGVSRIFTNTTDDNSKKGQIRVCSDKCLVETATIMSRILNYSSDNYTITQEEFSPELEETIMIDGSNTKTLIKLGDFNAKALASFKQDYLYVIFILAEKNRIAVNVDNINVLIILSLYWMPAEVLEKCNANFKDYYIGVSHAEYAWNTMEGLIESKMNILF